MLMKETKSVINMPQLNWWRLNDDVTVVAKQRKQSESQSCFYDLFVSRED